MIIEQEVTQSFKTRICDFCPLVDRKTVKSPARYSCKICKKDLCSEHTEFDDRDNGDYPDTYCKKCWADGEEFRAKQEVLVEKHDAEMEELNKAWVSKANGNN